MSEAIEWAGRVGAEWAKQADGLDGLLGPMGDVGIAALGDVSGQRLLDLGCGAGATSLTLSEQGAEVVGVDISPDLIARGRQRAEALGSGAQFEVADASAHQFDAPFDLLFSRFGAMFFDQPLVAYANLRAQMKPGGRAVIVAWTDPAANLWAEQPIQVGRDLFPDRGIQGPGAGKPGPFAWSQQARFVPMLEKAGWRDIVVDPFEQDVVMSAGDSADPLERGVHFCMRIGPLARHLRDIPKAERADLPGKLADALRPYLKRDAVRVTGKAWLITMVTA